MKTESKSDKEKALRFDISFEMGMERQLGIIHDKMELCNIVYQMNDYYKENAKGPPDKVAMFKDFLGKVEALTISTKQTLNFNYGQVMQQSCYEALWASTRHDLEYERIMFKKEKERMQNEIEALRKQIKAFHDEPEL